MPNLFPVVGISPSAPVSTPTVTFGRSWKFDYTTGDFVLTPTGKVAESSGVDAWVEWCRKAIRTERYRYMIYSRKTGQEFDDLIARHLTRQANESEIVRITTETLKVDARTATVGNFSFTWDGDQCLFICRISNVRGQAANIDGSMVIP